MTTNPTIISSDELKIRVHLQPTMDIVNERPLLEGNYFQIVSSKRYRLRTNSFNQDTIQVMVSKVVERPLSYNDICERIQRLST